MIRRIFGALLVPLLIASIVSVPVYAAVKSDDSIIIAEGETLNDDLFAAGNEVLIEGTVNGDIYAAGSRVSIRGTVNGDVIAGASTIEISGTVRDDVRVVGNSITLVGANIGDSVTVAGNELSIDSDSIVRGGLLFGGRSLSLDGSIGRGITSGNQVTRIDGPVGRTVRIAAEDITIGSEAVIDGDFEYSSEVEATINGTIQGEVIYSQSDVNIDAQGFLRALTVGLTVWAFVGAAIVGAIMLLLFPTILRKADQKFGLRPGLRTAHGAIALFIVLPIFLVMLITVVGIPFGVVLLVLWLLAIYFAKFFAAYAVGSRLLNQIDKKFDNTSSRRAYVAMLLGLVLYYGLRLLPGFGFLIRFATTIVGLGMMVSLYSRPQQPHKTGKKEA